MTAPSRVVDLELDRTWAYGPDTQHGGYLVELLAAAALDGAVHPHPLSTTTHFLAAPKLGAVQIQVEVLRLGRSVSSYSARMVQDDRVCLDATITAGLLKPPGEPAWLQGEPPVLPPLEECVRSALPAGLPRNGILENLDLRIDPATIGVVGTVPEVRAYARFASGREPDPMGLLCLADGMPPVTFALGQYGWVPTVQLTVHVRALPAPGWVRVVQRAQLIQDGWLDETCEIWDSAGRLVAQATQLAGYRPR